jgi:hypothetical protein
LPSPVPALLTGYRPRAATNDLKEIVEDAMEEMLRVWDDRFRDTYGPLHPRVKHLLEAFIRCGDLHFGFARVRCVNSECTKKDEKIVPFSCKARGLCPSCGQRRAIEWAERMVDFVLPRVPYRQLVFTIPVALRNGFLRDRALYGELCRVAYSATRDYLRERAPHPARSCQAVPAMVASPQSFGDLLVPHAHVHSLVSLGLFRQDGRFFPMEEVDFSGLEQLFRKRFFEMMLEKEKVLPETVERFLAWEHSGFAVNSDRKLDADDRPGIERLLSYMERPAVSLRRLTYRSDGMVHYQGKFHPRLGTDHQLVTPVEFLAMLVPHVALKYEVTIRSYGAISTTFRRRAGWLQHPPTDEPPRLAMASPPGVTEADPGPPPPPLDAPLSAPLTSRPGSASCPKHDEDSESIRNRKRGWARLISKIWKDDPGVCRNCGKRMKIIAVIGPDQHDVIERILRHLRCYDPPWKRVRKTRGPPPRPPPGDLRSGPPTQPRSPAGPRATIDPVIPDELYSVDPIPPDEQG